VGGFSDLIVGTLETDEERQARLAGYEVPAALQASVPTRAEITTSPLNAATGHAYGVDVHVAQAGGGSVSPLTGWAAYSFGRATRTAYGVTRPFDYDRRHAVSIAGNLKLGSRLALSATGRWATGFPRTPVRGVRLALVADVNDVDRDGNREERVPQRDGSGHPLFQPDLGDLSTSTRRGSPISLVWTPVSPIVRGGVASAGRSKRTSSMSSTRRTRSRSIQRSSWIQRQTALASSNWPRTGAFRSSRRWAFASGSRPLFVSTGHGDTETRRNKMSI
jgi:hypothetical protein